MKKMILESFKAGLLTVDEEIKLVETMNNGDSFSAEQARNRMIITNIRLVIKIASQFKDRGAPFEDLVSEGICGLMKAVDKFKVDKGTKFSSYAAWWIKREMKVLLSKYGANNMVNVSPNLIYESLKVKSESEELESSLGRKPTDDEVMEKTDCKKRKLRNLRRIGNFHCVSMDNVLANGFDVPNESEFYDEIEKQDIYRAVRRSLDILDDNESIVIEFMILSDGYTLKDVGELIEKSAERVRQLKNQALDKIRKHIT